MLAIVRADGSAAIGAGHLVRCAALAGELRRLGWQVEFASSAGSRAAFGAIPGVAESLRELPPRALAPEGLREQWREGVELLVVDHYGLDASFEAAARPWARRILAIDDLADRSHDADIVLDQTFGRREADYAGRVRDGCQLLLGPRYALLRPRFAELREEALGRRRGAAPGRRLLVSFGMGDATAVLLKFVEALGRLREPVRADILVGGSRTQALRERLAACAPHRVELHAADADAAALMAQADLALGAGGTTSWERCCLGLPALLVVLADNQRTVVSALAGAGAARSLGAASALDPARLAAELDAALGDRAGLEVMSAAAAALCDGAGARRVANLLA